MRHGVRCKFSNALLVCHFTFCRLTGALNKSGNFLSAYATDIAISPDGKKFWGINSSVPVDATPAVAASGVIYFITSWEALTGIQQNGLPQWQVGTRGNNTASSAIGDDETIYVRDNLFLCAINSTNGLAPLAKSSWPMFRANPQHTGRMQN